MVELNLFRLYFPLSAIVSILHRISGMILFCLLPTALFILEYSLDSEAHFIELKAYLNKTYVKIICFGLLVPCVYHMLSGIRHILCDLGFGESYNIASKTAIGVILGTLLISATIGYSWF